ncbi:hypothetical protein [Massilia rhizosphaerae]|uniref:hypothetical protein n=1 Tax=Massilia rhizosphaerae TaxID=2784389 RepID=UPI0018DE7A5A|nr:hypothetical protein [Massilia rhizosphaerae]
MPEAIVLPLLNPRPRVVIDDFMLEAEALVGHAANNRAHFRDAADLKLREQAAMARPGVRPTFAIASNLHFKKVLTIEPRYDLAISTGVRYSTRGTSTPPNGW